MTGITRKATNRLLRHVDVMVRSEEWEATVPPKGAHVWARGRAHVRPPRHNLSSYHAPCRPWHRPMTATPSRVSRLRQDRGAGKPPSSRAEIEKAPGPKPGNQTARGKRISASGDRDAAYALPVIPNSRAALPPRIAAFCVAERRRREDLVHRMLLPRNRVIGAEQDLARADLRDEVAERLRRKYQRVEIELLRYSVGFFFSLMFGVAVRRRRRSRHDPIRGA